jgi:hypothetical protein
MTCGPECRFRRLRRAHIVAVVVADRDLGRRHRQADRAGEIVRVGGLVVATGEVSDRP